LLNVVFVIIMTNKFCCPCRRGATGEELFTKACIRPTPPNGIGPASGGTWYGKHARPTYHYRWRRYRGTFRGLRIVQVCSPRAALGGPPTPWRKNLYHADRRRSTD